MMSQYFVINIFVFFRNFPETLISVTVLDPLSMHSSSVLRDCDVTLVVSSRTNLRRIDSALRNVFDTKYQVILYLLRDVKLKKRLIRLDR